MPMKDLGIEAGVPYEVKETKKWYPRLCVSLEEFPELGTIGAEANMTIKVRVKSVTDNDDGGTIDLEVYKAGLGEKSKADRSYARLRGGR